VGQDALRESELLPACRSFDRSPKPHHIFASDVSVRILSPIKDSILTANAKSRPLLEWNGTAQPALFPRLNGGLTMRFILGIVIGVFLTIAGAYLRDESATSTVASGDPEARTIVNWDVAALDWQLFKDRTHEGWRKISQNLPEKL
jgi:hypothetical protein